MTLTDEQVDKLIADLGFPMFVKPAGNGSSFGVTEVNERKELADALTTAGSEGGRVLYRGVHQGHGDHGAGHRQRHAHARFPSSSIVTVPNSTTSR